MHCSQQNFGSLIISIIGSVVGWWIVQNRAVAARQAATVLFAISAILFVVATYLSRGGLSVVHSVSSFGFI